MSTTHTSPARRGRTALLLVTAVLSAAAGAAAGAAGAVTAVGTAGTVGTATASTTATTARGPDRRPYTAHQRAIREGVTHPWVVHRRGGAFVLGGAGSGEARVIYRLDPGRGRG